MIRNFQKQTDDLNDYERNKIIPLMVRSMRKHVGKEAAVTNCSMREGLEAHGYDVSDARIRKMINYIRVKGLVVGLVASARGYYITDDVKEFEDYINSLRQRVDAIEAVADCLEEQLEILIERQKES